MAILRAKQNTEVEFFQGLNRFGNLAGGQLQCWENTSLK
jgi:hypothetical protein